MVKIKGSVVAEALSSARERLGEAGFRDLLAHLDEEARKALEQQILPMSWISLDLWVRFLDADLQISHHGDERAFIARTEMVIERQLKGLYKNFVTESPEALLKKLNLITSSYYQGIQVEPKMTGPTTAVIRYLGFERHQRVIGCSIVGFYRKALELAGAKGIVVRFTTPVEVGVGYAELTISWI